MLLNSGGRFPENYVLLYPVEESYLDSSLIEYYIPKHQQSGIDYQKTQGKDDLIKSLYSDQETKNYGENMDPFDINSQTLSPPLSDFNYSYSRTQEIKAILPLGIKSVLSINGGDTIRLSIDNYSSMRRDFYRFLVRGLPQKVPGFFFMSYKQVQFFLQGIISFPQAYELMYFQSLKSAENKIKYDEKIGSAELKNLTFNYPKQRLLIRLNEKISGEERNIIV